VEDFRKWSADRMERAYTDGHELVVLEFSATRVCPLIIWGIYTGPRFAHPIATGESANIDQAKVAAEAALAYVVNGTRHSLLLAEDDRDGVSKTINLFFHAATLLIVASARTPGGHCDHPQSRAAAMDWAAS
jgi:hypothetical protein